MDDLKKYYKGKKVLITGADGFIGSYLTEKLLEYGAQVFIYTRGSNRDEFELKNLNQVKDRINGILVGNIEDKQASKKIISCVPNIIFHLAANDNVRYSIENPSESIKTNINGTLNILNAAKALRDISLERVVCTSSAVVYGTNSHPSNEESPLNPNTPYAAGKASSDWIALAYHQTYGLPVAIIRPFNTYGPRKLRDVIPTFIEQAVSNQPIRLEGGGKATRDFTYVSDMVDAFLLMGADKNAIGETVNFGSGKDISMKYLAQKIIQISKSNSSIIDVPERPGQDFVSCCDNSKAKKLFGWSQKISLEKGLNYTIEYYLDKI